MPKSGKKVQFDGRQAEVIDTNVLGQKLTLRFEDGERTTITADEFAGGAAAKPVATQTESSPAGPKPQQQRRKQRPSKPKGAQAIPKGSDKPAQQKPQSAPPAGQTEKKPKRRRRRSRRKPKQD